MNPLGRRAHHRACIVCDDRTSVHTVHHNAPTRPPPKGQELADKAPGDRLMVHRRSGGALVLVGYLRQKTLPARG
ncbi:hypothetical protein ACIQFZ_35450 [Streptomyces sp. NPDC093064]|uniref:hypothetical protein n=1 Tax=unclassified Streptomyces TaxID=2593676 RepID=UPI00341AC5B3